MIRTAIKRRSALNRGTKPLRRTTRLRARGNTSHARRPRGGDFMSWTSRQPCFVRRFGVEFYLLSGVRGGLLEQHLDCDGRIEVDHAGDRFEQGDGTRAFDWTCIPLCARHHRMRTSWAGTLGQAGIFFGYTREAMRRWCDAAIARQHKLAGFARIEVPTC